MQQTTKPHIKIRQRFKNNMRQWLDKSILKFSVLWKNASLKIAEIYFDMTAKLAGLPKSQQAHPKTPRKNWQKFIDTIHIDKNQRQLRRTFQRITSKINLQISNHVNFQKETCKILITCVKSSYSLTHNPTRANQPDRCPLLVDGGAYRCPRLLW